MYKRLEHCLCCKNPNLYTILDLNQQPPANSFHKEDVVVDSYELKLMGCDICWHSQLSIAVDPAELFRHYLYVSGTSATLKDYFEKFADHYSELLLSQRPDELMQNRRCLDIACNDGSQLTAFAWRGWETWGVDPAENLVPRAREKGHQVICDFWNTKTAESLPKFDLITAQNVFAHTADVDEFLEACKLVMHDKSMLVIQTSQAEMFEHNEFDTIYHEHISFFSTFSLLNIANRHGLYLNNVYVSDIHGGSYVFELALYKDRKNTVDARLREEHSRYNREFYDKYQQQAMQCLADLKQYVERAREEGVTVVGYGAAAKGMTVLNAGGITLDYIVDDNPLKQGLLTPGMNIPVVTRDRLRDETANVIVIPLAWNFYKEITERVQSLRPDNRDVFVQYFPHFRVND